MSLSKYRSIVGHDTSAVIEDGAIEIAVEVQSSVILVGSGWPVWAGSTGVR
ncbi:hypothetical protein [Mycobacterium marinum]|uniref:hypothetical protein n=1 Tax=Mycobacterium marinum TaxID=1781 RepID=UPI001293F9E8|nr:hypothetical protein [Mycobacterium marinum]